jgi:SIR2-like protein
MLQRQKGDIEKLRNALATGDVIPFVGAGMSQSIGLPGWGKFLLTCLEGVDSGETCNKINNLISEERFPEAASEIETAIGAEALQKLIEATFGDQQIDGKEALEPLTLIPHLTNGPVATTNFDRVIECVFHGAAKPLKSVHIGAAMENATMALIEDRSDLMKIHGTWNQWEDRVLTAKEYRATYGGLTAKELNITHSLPFLLLQMFARRRMLFLGCGLGQDLTMELLAVIKEKTKADKHYALMAQNEEYERVDRRLRESGIIPIWYPPKQRAEAISAILRLVMPNGAPSERVARFFNRFGLFTLTVTLATWVPYQKMMENGSGPLFLVVGLPLIAVCELILLSVARKYATESPTQHAAERLLPAFGFKMTGRHAKLRWLVWFLFIAFPLYICAHFIHMQENQVIKRRASDGIPAGELRKWDIFDPTKVHWKLLFKGDPIYWWGNDAGQAWPVIQPWGQTILGTGAILFGLAYTFQCATGRGCNRLRSRMILNPKGTLEHRGARSWEKGGL